MVAMHSLPVNVAMACWLVWQNTNTLHVDTMAVLLNRAMVAKLCIID
jgi:hypothetical protein